MLSIFCVSDVLKGLNEVLTIPKSNTAVIIITQVLVFMVPKIQKSPVDLRRTSWIFPKPSKPCTLAHLKAHIIITDPLIIVPYLSWMM